jgi:mRNA interferase HigB
VNVVSKRAIRGFAERHPDALTPLMQWFRLAKKASWVHIIEVRKQFPTADAVPPFTVFSIAGNKYRLIAEIEYLRQVVHIRQILTHAEYDRGAWKI